MGAHNAGFDADHDVIDARARFLALRAGQYVIVHPDRLDSGLWGVSTDWWMGQVCEPESVREGAAPPSRLLLEDVADASLHWVRRDQISHVRHALDGLFCC